MDFKKKTPAGTLSFPGSLKRAIMTGIGQAVGCAAETGAARIAKVRTELTPQARKMMPPGLLDAPKIPAEWCDTVAPAVRDTGVLTRSSS